MKQSVDFSRHLKRPELEVAAAGTNFSPKMLAVLVLPLLLIAVLATMSLLAKQTLSAEQQELIAKQEQIESLTSAKLSLEERSLSQAPDQDLAMALRKLEEEQRWKQRVVNNKPDLRVGEGASSFSALMAGLARQSTPGLWLTGLNLQGGGGEISFIGGAKRGDLVAEFVNTLQAERVFQGRQFAEIEIRRPTLEEMTEGLPEAEANVLKAQAERGVDVTDEADLLFSIRALPVEKNVITGRATR